MSTSTLILCQACLIEAQVSTVKTGGSAQTLAACQSFFDNAGKLHNHDRNLVMTDYDCSNGHHWAETVSGECWCGWSALSKDFNDECDCSCHKGPGVHVVACCLGCLGCGKRIKASREELHKERCNKIHIPKSKTSTSNYSVAFIKYARLLDRLFELRGSGLADEDTEGALAEAMNDCRFEMTPDEELRIDELVSKKKLIADKKAKQ